jgi:hypothetical protein
MAAKNSKVFLESAGRDHTVRAGETEQWMYRVVRLVNTLEPRVDSLVKQSAVERMILDGIDVTITPKHER